MVEEWNDLEEDIDEVNAEIEAIAKADESCRRLLTVLGVGPVVATAMVAAIGNGSAFRRGREFATWLGLVPQQCSTGGKPAAVKSTVIVSATPESAIDAATVPLHHHVSAKQIETLPINQRKALDFTLLDSSVQPDTLRVHAVANTSGFNVMGQRPRSNSLQLDGSDLNDEVISFLRHRSLDATNAFSAIEDPPYTRTQYGGSLSGPFRRDRTFFFAAFEQIRRQESGFSRIALSPDTFALTAAPQSPRPEQIRILSVARATTPERCELIQHP